MTPYRTHLPQLAGAPFLTDGGIETTLIFHEGFALPYFAAFDLLLHAAGTAARRRYFETYASLARRYALGCILESATWRASADWGAKLGYAAAELAEVNRQAVRLLHGVRESHAASARPLVISGCIGPRSDGYQPTAFMPEAEVEDYHRLQASALYEADADLLTAITMTYAEEAIGITRAARVLDMPVVISFTVETDGTLPSGQPLHEATAQHLAFSQRARRLLRHRPPARRSHLPGLACAVSRKTYAGRGEAPHGAALSQRSYSTPVSRAYPACC